MSESLPWTELQREEVRRMIEHEIEAYDSNVCQRFDDAKREMAAVRELNEAQTETLGQIAGKASETHDRMVRVEAHSLSMYGNGSGRKGYLEMRAELDERRWTTQLQVNHGIDRTLRVIQGQLKRLVMGQRFDEGVASANARMGKLAFAVVGALGTGVTGLLIDLLRHKLAH